MGVTTIAIHGAAGRMGRRLIALASETPERFKMVAALDRAGAPEIGMDAGRMAGVAELGVPVTSELGSAKPEVMIDFSIPAAMRAILARCAQNKISLLIGTTGITADDHKLIDAAAGSIAILQATNTSLGINLLLQVVADVAKKLGPDYDIELVESHHNQKKDAPSGTAISLLESICAATGKNPATDITHGREGPDCKRQPGTIGVHSLRMGDVIGEHHVTFATSGERIEIGHRATTRDTFARGAIRAAAWLVPQKPGRYSMKDVLGL